MLKFYQNWRDQGIIKKSEITAEQWRLAIDYLPLLQGLSSSELTKLQHLATLFIYKKNFIATHDLQVSLEMAQLIALQACLPILNLGMHYYKDWSDIVIYPDVFFTLREIQDEAGLVHRVKQHLTGEAWLQGPVVLAWRQVETAGDLDGENLVIHEFAHKLDMLNGSADGFPILHKNMSQQYWFESLSHAYKDLRDKIKQGKAVCIDKYAATEPAEFFAVMSEVFFEKPALIHLHYPDVYTNFKAFYKQDTLTRLSNPKLAAIH